MIILNELTSRILVCLEDLLGKELRPSLKSVPMRCRCLTSTPHEGEQVKVCEGEELLLLAGGIQPSPDSVV